MIASIHSRAHNIPNMSNRKRALRVLRAGTLRSLASALKVSPSTIHRWKTKGLPPEREASLESLANTPEQSANKARTTRAEHKALTLNVDELAVVGGVTRGTARRWKKKGVIPKRSQGFLQSTTKKSKTKPKQREPENYKGRFTKGRYYTLDVNADLEPEVYIDVARWAGNIRKSPSKQATYQFTAKGVVQLDPEQTLYGSAKAKKILADDKYEIEMPACADSSMRGALNDLFRMFAANESQDLHLQSVRVYIRTPL